MYRTNRQTVKNDFEPQELDQFEGLLIEALYLGVKLKEWGRRKNFSQREATGFTADLLIGWARLMSRTLREGEPIRLPETGLHSRRYWNA